MPHPGYFAYAYPAPEGIGTAALELSPPKGADWWRSRSKRVSGGGR
jgi:hypothetical protein